MQEYWREQNTLSTTESEIKTVMQEVAEAEKEDEEAETQSMG